MEKIRIEQHSVGGLMWIAGWFFTIGFLNVTLRTATHRRREIRGRC